jgi:hypothetical protein
VLTKDSDFVRMVASGGPKSRHSGMKEVLKNTLPTPMRLLESSEQSVEVRYVKGDLLRRGHVPLVSAGRRVAAWRTAISFQIESTS